MNAQPKTITQDGSEVLDPRKALQEQTLAVDLAGVEIDRAIATAHKYPRSIDIVIKRIATLALYNQESAESCIYSLPRGKKPIIGPSIGFANIVLQAWGNCRAASQIVYIDTKQKVVIAQGAFMDLESNSQSIVPVNRRIVDSKGHLYSDDMQIVTGMAAASIARRNAILQGVPRGIWLPIWNDALGIVRGDITTFEENKEKALKAMAQFGVKPEQIFLYLGLKGEVEMTFEHIPYVRGMYQQLRDGAITVEEMFDPRRMTGRGFETVENPLGEEGGGEEGESSAQTLHKPALAPAAAAQADPTAGMGDDDQTEAEPQPTPAAVAPAASAAKGQGSAKQTPAATQAAPAPQNAQASPTAAKKAGPEAAKASGKDETAAPKDEQGFMDYWEAFLASATTESQIKNKWSADRALRTNCRIAGDIFNEAKAMKEQREAELRQ